jgi:putative aldouronate transport system permease protein
VIYLKWIKVFIVGGSVMNLAKTGNINPVKNKKSRQGLMLFFVIFPFLLLSFLFSYLPLYGWIYAFYDFRPPLPLSQTPFVGLHWFQIMAYNKAQFSETIRVLENTFAISGLNILTSFLPVIFAVFMAEIKLDWAKKTVQVVTTLPHFISWVLVYSLAFSLFSVNNGVVNHILINIGFIKNPINWLASDSHTWLSMCVWSLWKGIGWGAIMYIAALASVDQEIYEAARVDGAGRFRMMWHISIPSILPTYFVLLLLTIANFLNNGMDQFYVFQNAINKTHIEVLDLYVYNVGMGMGSISMATAVSMFKSFVSVCLLFLVNGMSKLFRGETII